MGWWESALSFESMIDDYLWYIKTKLKGWVRDMIWSISSEIQAKAGIAQDAMEAVARFINSNIEELLPTVVAMITSAKQYAEYLTDSIKLKLDKRIDAVEYIIENLPTISLTDLHARITSARQFAESLADILRLEMNKQVKDLAHDITVLGKANKAYTDNVKSELTNLMQSMDKVAGSARVKFQRDMEVLLQTLEKEVNKSIHTLTGKLLKGIKDLEGSIATARAEIKRELGEGIAGLAREASEARGKLMENLTQGISRLEREAREAREVIEGTLIQMLEQAETSFEAAIEDLERTFDTLLHALTGRILVLERWTKNASKWLDTELNKYQDRILTWTVDGFEGILDRVFK